MHSACRVTKSVNTHLESVVSTAFPTDDNITRDMHSACRVTKSVKTHLESVVSTAFPRQQLLYERASIFR
jgi:hypothetical protein